MLVLLVLCAATASLRKAAHQAELKLVAPAVEPAKEPAVSKQHPFGEPGTGKPVAAAAKEAKAAKPLADMSSEDRAAAALDEMLEHSAPTEENAEWWEHTAEEEAEQDPVTAIVSTCVMLLIWFGIWYYCCFGQARAAPGGGQPLECGNLMACGRGKQPQACCEAVCCWEFTWAETVSRVRFLPQFLTLPVALLIGCVSTVLASPTASCTVLLFDLLRCWTRGEMRKAYTRQPNTPTQQVTDCLAVSCCCCCAAWQEAEFAEVHFKDGGLVK